MVPSSNGFTGNLLGMTIIVIIIIIIINSIAIVLHTTASATQRVESVSFFAIIISLTTIKLTWNGKRLVSKSKQCKNTPFWLTNRNFGLTDQTIWPDKKWQQLFHCSRFITISFKVSSLLVELSFGQYMVIFIVGRRYNCVKTVYYQVARA